MKVIITGGAGFIGANAARRYLARGDEVVILDNRSRTGAEANLGWLAEAGTAKVFAIDLRDPDGVNRVFRDASDATLVLHLGGQVAVTASVADPRFDFETNALGTLNVLEAMRRNSMNATLIYSSTNKVYGAMPDVATVEGASRYEYSDAAAKHGIAESRPIDCHSPYGCSKGAADQYVRDYQRIYGLSTVVFRQSCIYGPRQFGIEDQGWVAWFAIAAELELPLTIYGDGKQVRDILFVEDLLDAFDAAHRHIEVARGRIYNIGGGPANAISLLDLIGLLRRGGRNVPYLTRDWRPGDQHIYVSDIRRARDELGWEPRVSWRDGVDRLNQWVKANRAELRAICERRPGLDAVIRRAVAGPGEA